MSFDWAINLDAARQKINLCKGWENACLASAWWMVSVLEVNKSMHKIDISLLPIFGVFSSFDL